MAGYLGRLTLALGVLCTALTLFLGLSALLDIAVRLRPLMAAWRAATVATWSWLAGWIGLKLPESVALLLSFLVFALVLAVGARLRTGRASSVRLTWSRALLGTLAGLVISASGFALWLLGFIEYEMAVQKTSRDWSAALPIATYVLMTAALSYPTFAVLTRGMAGARQLFPISLAYMGAAYMAPVLTLWLGLEYSAARGTSRFQDNIDWMVGMLLTAPVLVALLMAIMLSIAPAEVLRRRLIASLALTVVLAVANEVLKRSPLL
jgi:hypothetical protein